LAPDTVGDLEDLASSFKLSLRARNAAPRTTATYMEAIEQPVAFLRQDGRSTAAVVTRSDIESYLVHLQDQGRKPATVSNRFRALQQFFGFLADEGEIPANPMANMALPRVPEQPVKVLTEQDLEAVLGTCATRGRREDPSGSCSAHPTGDAIEVQQGPPDGCG
jgi:site-specific recombinase XerD